MLRLILGLKAFGELNLKTPNPSPSATNIENYWRTWFSKYHYMSIIAKHVFSQTLTEI